VLTRKGLTNKLLVRSLRYIANTRLDLPHSIGLVESPSLVLDNNETYWTNPLLKCVDKLRWSTAKWWSKMKSIVMMVDM
jgi:hypothetical protein